LNLKFRGILFGLICISSMTAQTQFFTIATTQVGPGVVRKKVIETNIPWTINVLEIDLKNPEISIESVKARDLLSGTEQISSMVVRKNRTGHSIVGSVNGDYFSGAGVPINAQVVNGEILKPENINPASPSYWSTIGFDPNNRPAISTNIFRCFIEKRSDSLQCEIVDINSTRGTDQTILYNSYFGSTTGTNSHGFEMQIHPLNRWLVNDTLLCVIESLERGTGAMAIPAGKAVISGNGSDSTFLSESFNVGDTLKLFVGILPAISPLNQLIGGFPRIVQDRQNVALAAYKAEGGSSTFATDRHPRTGVGFSADSLKLYLITVDGRQTTSLGMSLIELADFMISIGVAHGMNLDGGGSTEMYVRGKVQNSPSDGQERYVGNCLMVVSSAAVTNLAHIQIEPDNYRLFDGNSIRFSASGWDTNFNPEALVSGTITYSISPEIGTIDQSGNFLAEGIGKSGMVWIHDAFGLSDSATIHLKGIQKIGIKPSTSMIDTTHSITLRVEVVDEDEINQNVSADRLHWQSLDTAICEVDSLGKVTGKKEGKGRIVVTFYTYSDTANVTVKICEGEVSVESMDSPDHWTISGEYYDAMHTYMVSTDSPKTEGTHSLKLGYSFIRLSNNRSWVNLNSDIFINGIPSEITLDFKSNGAKHKLYLTVADIDGELFQTTIIGYAQDSTKFSTLHFSCASFIPLTTGATLNYPITLKSIRIMLGNTAPVDSVNSGVVYLDNLRVIYPGSEIQPAGSGKPVSDGFHLFQNYPNPYNASTQIRYRIPESGAVSLRIYDMAGYEVAELVDEQQAAGEYSILFQMEELPSGLYFYQLKSCGNMQIRKMVLIK